MQVVFPSLNMITLRNKRKLAAMNRDNYEDHPWNIQAFSTNSPWIQKDYITQVSEEIESKVTKKVSQEFSPRVTFWAPCYTFLLNAQARVHSGPVLETSRNSNRENQGTNEDCSQNDHHPEVGVSLSQSSQEFSPKETFHSDHSTECSFRASYVSICVLVSWEFILGSDTM